MQILRKMCAASKTWFSKLFESREVSLKLRWTYSNILIYSCRILYWEWRRNALLHRPEVVLNYFRRCTIYRCVSFEKTRVKLISAHINGFNYQGTYMHCMPVCQHHYVFVWNESKNLKMLRPTNRMVVTCNTYNIIYWTECLNI